MNEVYKGELPVGVFKGNNKLSANYGKKCLGSYDAVRATLAGLSCGWPPIMVTAVVSLGSLYSCLCGITQLHMTETCKICMHS